MIIVCPECSSRYNVEAEIMSLGGRMMRCTKCAYEWFYEEATEEAPPSDNFDDLLESLQETLEEEDEQEEEKPNIDFSKRETLNSRFDSEKKESPSKQKTGGIFLGVFVGLIAFIILFIGGLMFKASVLEHFPASKPLYVAMGFKIMVPGEGLVFDGIETEWDGTKLKIEGRVLNLLGEDSLIPDIALRFQSESEESLDEGVLSVKQEKLKGEDAVSFQHEIQVTPDIKAQTSSLKFSFISLE